MRGNFLAFAFDEDRPSRRQWAFGYPSWTPERRAIFARRYREAGYTDVPFALYGAYGNVFAWWDYRQDLDGAARLYDGLLGNGLRPLLFVATNDAGDRPQSWDDLRRLADLIVPHAVAHGVRFFVTGWELDQLPGYLYSHGQHALDWIRYLSDLLPAGCRLAHHPGAHRTDSEEVLYSGWFEDRDWDRFDWCQRASAAGLDAMLANWHPDCPEDKLIYQMLEEPQKHGAGPGALGMWAWAGLEGYLFEHTQLDPERHKRLADAMMQDRRCRGFC